MRFCRILIAGLSLPTLLVLLGVVWLSIRDPLMALPKTSHITLLQDKKENRRNYIWHDLTFSGGPVGCIHAILILPASSYKKHHFPLVVVLGGLSARENVQYLPKMGQNAVLVYDWPFSTYLPRSGSALLFQVPAYYQKVSQMPGQIGALITWVRSQPYIDSKRISLLGFSLGAMAAPAAQRILENNHIPVHWTVLANGGCPIGEVLMAHPVFQNQPGKPWVQWGLTLLSRHVDPSEHLPHLHGRFLVISSNKDQMVPLSAARRLYVLTPSPKTKIVLKGGHMGIWHQEEIRLLRETTQRIHRWLLTQGAIN